MTYLNLKPVEFSAMGKRNQDAFVWEGRILLPKYDGCFAMVAFLDGAPLYIKSRTGEFVKSMAHTYTDLLRTYPWLAHRDGLTVVLGEAWTPGKGFSELSGMFRRHSAQHGLGFAPFDIVGGDYDGLFSDAPYSERLALLQRPAILNPLIFPPHPLRCESEAHAWRYARNLKELGGYDGAVCSAPKAGYSPGAGRAGEFIKLKPLVTYSLEVVAVENSVGAKTGRLVGTPVVRFQGGRCGVGTGFSHEQAELWADYPASIIGKIIEVAAMGISTNGLLREPRLVGFRGDVTTPDY